MRIHLAVDWLPLPVSATDGPLLYFPGGSRQKSPSLLTSLASQPQNTWIIDYPGQTNLITLCMLAVCICVTPFQLALYSGFPLSLQFIQNEHCITNPSRAGSNWLQVDLSLALLRWFSKWFSSFWLSRGKASFGLDSNTFVSTDRMSLCCSLDSLSSGRKFWLHSVSESEWQLDSSHFFW